MDGGTEWAGRRADIEAICSSNSRMCVTLSSGVTSFFINILLPHYFFENRLDKTAKV